MPSKSNPRGNIENGCWAADESVAFASVFDDLIGDAESRLDLSPAWSESARSDLVASLRRRLSEIAAPPLLELYRSSPVPPVGAGGRERYRAFVSRIRSDDLGELRSALPVLGALLDITSAQWVETTNELVERIDGTRGSLAAVLAVPADDRIVGVRTGLGDRHANGRTVASVTVSSGVTTIYKPRSLSNDRQFFELWSEFRRRQGDELPVPKLVTGDGFGLMEFVEHAPVTDAGRYWHRAGEVAGLLHLCAAEDFHYENLVAAGNQVVPVDLECIDQPNRFAEREDRLAFVTDSILATGLFPNWYRQQGAGGADGAGLFPGQRSVALGRMRFWRNLGTDDIDHPALPFRRDQGHNAARDGTGATVACHIESLLRGIEDAFRVAPRLLDEMDPWAPGRFLSRPTTVYHRAMKRMLAVDALEDRVVFEKRSLDLPEMEPELEELLGERREELVAADAGALRRLDVPLHRAEGTDLQLDGGQRIRQLFHESGLIHRRERLRRIGDSAGVRAHQVLVRLAVEQFEQRTWVRTAPPELGTGAPPGRSAAIAAAEAIAERLAEQRLDTREGSAWLEVDQLSPLRGSAFQTNLYVGSDGIALFFAALAGVTHDERWAEQATRALAALPSPHHPEAWVENGWAGRIYARSVASRLLADSSLAAHARAIAAEGLPRPVEDDDKLDVLGGWSGVLLALLAAADNGVNAAALSDRIATWLATQVQRRLGDPLHRAATIRMGFAHGTTGVGYALSRAAIALDHDAARRAARQLVEIEEERIAARGGIPGRLSGFGAQKVPTRSWCWGVSGYAMTRAQDFWGRVHGADSHLGTAARIVAERQRGRSHACCGEAGRLMALVELAVGGDDGCRASADALAQALVDDAEVDGPWQFYNATSMTTPGLFWGTAGVGYALLRYAAPEVVPNFLLFEPALSSRPAAS